MKLHRARIASAILLVVVGCGGSHDNGDHAHPHGQEQHGGQDEQEEQERPGLSVTVYQGGLELFMEYPAFVEGQPSPLVAHFTDARDADRFRVVKTGRVTATLRYTGDGEESFIAETLLRDGIFKPVVTPTRSGDAKLSLRLEGDQVAGRVDVGSVVVHPSVDAAVAAAPPEGGEQTVPFLKEQQWKTEYATGAVETRTLQGSVAANGELEAVAGQAAELSAPVAGRIPVEDAVPALGQVVSKGQLLVRLIPTSTASSTDLSSITLEVARARSELGLAERELARAQDMLSARAIPARQVDSARVARDVAAARLVAAETQSALYRSTQTGSGESGQGSAFELRSPIDGVVFFAEVMPGSTVAAGAHLVSVVNSQRLWLVAKVYESEAALVEGASGASFRVSGFAREFLIDEAAGGRRVAVGAVVDEQTRTVPIIFEFPNPDGLLKPGMFAKVKLFTGATIRGVAVPESAIVDDGGKPTVFVMDGGESFFKRVIQPGVRSGGYVQVLAGVDEGRRVVSRGAYEMKLSTATGAIPEHGHQH